VKSPDLGPKISETWRGLIMDSAANLLGISTPNHTHDFSNHSDGYVHSKAALVQSVSGQPEIQFFNGFKLRNGFRIDEDYDFYDFHFT
jgi:hypothetical protein